MPSTLAPDIRSQFAKRLKSIRTQRGFERARHFARSLGIEENRYTRYERAEVEPSLTLIHKMCEALKVTPNELLGFGEYEHLEEISPAPGFAETAAEESAADRTSGSLAWRLAAEMVKVRVNGSAKAKPAGDPLAVFRETAKLFQRLQAEPFDTIAEIVADEAVQRSDAGQQAVIADLVEAYTIALTSDAIQRSGR